LTLISFSFFVEREFDVQALDIVSILGFLYPLFKHGLNGMRPTKKLIQTSHISPLRS